MPYKNNWIQLNKLPVSIRKKTTDYNLLLFEKLLAQEKEKDIRHTAVQVAQLLASEDCLYLYIKGAHFFSSLNGWMLMDMWGAKKMYMNVLDHASLEYANQFITVWIRDDWRMLKDVYTEL